VLATVTHLDRALTVGHITAQGTWHNVPSTRGCLTSGPAWAEVGMPFLAGTRTRTRAFYPGALVHRAPPGAARLPRGPDFRPKISVQVPSTLRLPRRFAKAEKKLT